MKSKTLLSLLGVGSLTLLLTGCPDYTTTFLGNGDVYHTTVDSAKVQYPEHCSVTIANHLFTAGADTERNACIKATKICLEWVANHRSTYLETFVCAGNSNYLTKHVVPMKRITRAY